MTMKGYDEKKGRHSSEMLFFSAKEKTGASTKAKSTATATATATPSAPNYAKAVTTTIPAT